MGWDLWRWHCYRRRHRNGRDGHRYRLRYGGHWLCMGGFGTSILGDFIFSLFGDAFPIWVKCVTVQHASFTETLQLLSFDFVPWNVSDTKFNIPILFIIRLYSFVQGPGNLYGFLVHFVVSSAQFLQGTVCILSMNHDDVGTAPGRNHINGFNWTKLL